MTSWALAAITVFSGAMVCLWLRRPDRDQVAEAFAAASPANPRTVAASERLANALPGKVFPRSHDDFVASIRSYWSSQELCIVPHCVVKPTNASDVSVAVRILSEEFTKKGQPSAHDLHFAIRSGGHAPNASSANTQGGVVIDMSHLNSVRVSDDGHTTTIEPAARWVDVYDKLEARGLAVAGGRASNVGVAGLTLGGGLSFFSPRTGFVCDNIQNFEIILADGSCVNANENTNRDLWVALKGGGNNFGIVTKFTTSSFPNSKIWAGYLYHPISAGPQLIKTFHKFCDEMNHDDHANAMLALGYDYKMRATGIASIIQYTKAVKKPPILQPFLEARRFWSTVKLKSLSDATKEVNGHSPAGRRQLFQSTTFVNNLELLQLSHDLYKDSLAQIKPMKSVAWALVFHPLPVASTSKGHSNAMGITTDKNLVIAQMSASWTRPEDDETISKLAMEILDKIEARAVETGNFNRYKYLNYATPTQNPISGYGEDSLAMLQGASKKYDPHGLFQKGCVGGFKLWERAQKSEMP